MNSDEINKLVETIVAEKTKYYWLYPLASIVIAIVGAYLLDFSKEKGKNLATKQDIQIITNKIETVKADIQNQQETEKLKRELKYNALLNSLTIIDCFLSNFIISKDSEISKQYSTVEETRKCHNNLILTCENPESLSLFSEIMFAKSNMTSEEIGQIFLKVNKYRNIVRQELGFGAELKLDPDKVWFGSVNFEPSK